MLFFTYFPFFKTLFSIIDWPLTYAIDKCLMCIGYYSIWDLFLENNVLNFGIYAPISSIMLGVCLCSNLCVDLNLMSFSVWIEKWFLQPYELKKLKSGARWSNTSILWRVPWFKDDPPEKKQTNPSTRASDTTTAWPWWASWRVVVTMTAATPPSLSSLVFLWHFSTSARFEC